MKKFATLGAAAVLSMGVATAANAGVVTFLLPGTTGSAASYLYTASAGSQQAVVTGHGYNVGPAALTSLGQLVAATTRRYANATGAPGGLGVFRTGDGQPQQVDNTGANEALRISLTGFSGKLTSAKFSYVDGDDTLRLYGINGTTMTLLGFGGEFVAPPAMTGGATVVPGAGSGDNRTYTVNFAGIGSYDSYLFTSNNEESDGYRLQSLVLAVPEPAQWAMMLGGFGLLGAAARRRRGVTTVYA